MVVAIFYQVDWQAENVSGQSKKPSWERKGTESSLVLYTGSSPSKGQATALSEVPEDTYTLVIPTCPTLTHPLYAYF